ncbi:complement C1q tumor necrosis factor-related protein 3-like isoform X2 [Oreochromis aureus]|nr:complement C1q tumor necrosis factor-related protein 3-like isoform X2 [Oreochromis aureus]
MTALVAEQKVKITFLEKENQDNVAKLKELEKKETEIDKLKQQLQDQVAKLEELERQTKEIHDIKQQLQVKRVAFSASLLDKGDGHTGPFNAHTTLIFKRVFTNIGNAYNPHTGIFTAPVRGAYHFEWYIGAHGDASHGTCAVLFKNGEHIFSAWEHQPSHFGTSSNAATLVLEVGDQAFLRLWINNKIYDNQNHHSTFSGHLIFNM